MLKRRQSREVPLPYDDGFRGAIAMLFSLPLLVMGFVDVSRSDDSARMIAVFAWFCGAFTLFFLIYLTWTHLLLSRTPPEQLRQIAAMQHDSRVSVLSRLLGLKSAEDWGMSAAFIALFVSVAAAIIGAREGGIWLSLIVLVTVAAAWATVAYAFALRYFRLDAAGEKITFDIDEQPTFTDYLSMAIMVSSVGAMSAGTPRTRSGLNTVRTHTFISFAFNAIVVAMAVSLITGLIATA